MNRNPGSKKRSLITGLLKLAVSTALIAFLLRKISVAELLVLVRTVNRTTLALAASCFLFSNALGSLQWHQLLRASGVPIGLISAFRFYFVGLFFNNFLPANIGGDAVKVYDVSRIGSSPYQAIAVTLLDRLIGIFALCVLATFSAFYMIGKEGINPYAFYILIFMGCMAPALGLYFIRPLGNLLRRVVNLIRPLSIDTRMSSILDHLGEFRARKRLVVRLIALSALIQGLRVGTHILVGLSLGVDITGTIILQFFVFVPLLSLAMIPPITINGLGIREGLGILLFANAGLADTDAFTLEFLTYVVSVVVSLLGLVFFLSRRKARLAGGGV